MKKLGLIYNPVSGHALFKGKIDFLIDLFQRHGILLTPYRTRGSARTAYLPQEVTVRCTPW